MISKCLYYVHLYSIRELLSQSTISNNKQTHDKSHIHTVELLWDIACSRGQALIYHSQMTWGSTQTAMCILEIHYQRMWLINWYYTNSIHSIHCYKHVLVISLLYMHNSLRHVSHQHIICTNSFLLGRRRFTYDGPLLIQKFPNIILHCHNIMMHNRSVYAWGVDRVF